MKTSHRTGASRCYCCCGCWAVGNQSWQHQLSLPHFLRPARPLTTNTRMLQCTSSPKQCDGKGNASGNIRPSRCLSSLPRNRLKRDSVGPPYYRIDKHSDICNIPQLFPSKTTVPFLVGSTTWRTQTCEFNDVHPKAAATGLPGGSRKMGCFQRF